MDGGTRAREYRTIIVKPYTPNVGAEIFGIDLKKPLVADQLEEVKQAFYDHLVLFFREQEISFEDHIRLGEYFGTLGQHVGVSTNSKLSDNPKVRKFHFDETSPDVSGNVWHTDQSCAPIPPMASILYNHTLPPDGGGDTGFASMYAAYDGLSERMKKYLSGLTAVHDGEPIFGAGTPKATHPIVAVHPVTRRKLLYVNDSFTVKINDVPRDEGESILRFLKRHCERVEWSCRFKWEPHSVAFWDNRCAHHRAINDYLPNVRSGYRVQIEGEGPPIPATD